jgi:hypothetical protein
LSICHNLSIAPRPLEPALTTAVAMDGLDEG